MERRSFLKATGGVVGGLTMGWGGMNQVAAAPAKEAFVLPRRVLGRTGQKVSIVGFPGLCMIHDDQETCTAAVQKAFKRGINYFDVAPAYGRGKAETRLGIALEGIDRDKLFLACKTKRRDKAGAREELEASLKLLKTDHFDLYQMHHLQTPEEVKQALGPDGAIKTFLEAQKEGKVKYLGFSAHTTKGALEALKGFDFDTVMFPINLVEYYKIGFGKAVLEQADKQGAAVVAIKPMCRGAWPKDMEKTRRWWYRPMEAMEEIELGLKFALSQPGVVSGFPPAFVDLADQAIDAVKDMKPITTAEIHKARALADSCYSIFKQYEDRVALGTQSQGPLYYDCSPCALV